MSRIRLVAAVAGALVLPAVVGAQTLTGGDAAAPSFGTPGATTSTSPELGGGPETGSSSLLVPGVVPEPASFLLTATGALVALVGYSRRPKR